MQNVGRGVGKQGGTKKQVLFYLIFKGQFTYQWASRPNQPKNVTIVIYSKLLRNPISLFAPFLSHYSPEQRYLSHVNPF